MNKTLLGCLAVLVVGAVVVGLLLVGQYNGLVEADQAVAASWAEVENVYQRRADLVPNLVATVKGAADFEQETLQQVVEARSRVGQVSAEAGAQILDDPQRFARFQQAQDALSSALSRLLVVVERYPELRATQNFADLQHQLEGTENRIAVARTRFNDAARAYNTRLKRVPARWFVGVLGWDFAARPYFEAQEGAAEVPRVEF
jgi:LemA protein